MAKPNRFKKIAVSLALAAFTLTSLPSVSLAQSTTTGQKTPARAASKSATAKKKAYSPTTARQRRNQLARARATARARELKELQTPRFRVDEFGREVPDVRAEAAIIYNPETGEVLWENHSKDQRSIASITKVMTALVFLESETPLSTMVTVQRTDVAHASTTYLRNGFQLPAEDLLNFLLVGSDKRGDQTSYNTDTMIVASIDPVTKQVAMLSLPRDTVNVPLPRQWRAYGFYGGVYPAKINSLWSRARGQANLFPGNKPRQRGFDALKGALGELYQIDIPYYIEVDFDGFKKIVDTFGGVAIDVQVPVADDHYPIGAGNYYDLYIPSGYQHMNGTQALAYARARHKTSDFDRAQRQQRVITSLRQQVDPASLLEPGRLDELVSTLKSSINTDIPAELFPALVSLAGQVDATEVRSLVFTPPTYQVECLSCYSLTPKVKAIRRAVKEVFTVDRAFEQARVKVSEEGAVVWVLNGSGTSGQAAGVADYLDYLGVDAIVPTSGGGRADRSDYTQTVVTVYNGAEEEMVETIAALEKALGVKVVLKNDPLVSADVVVITGTKTPALVAPD